jgi:hypothetical protein
MDTSADRESQDAAAEKDSKAGAAPPPGSDEDATHMAPATPPFPFSAAEGAALFACTPPRPLSRNSPPVLRRLAAVDRAAPVRAAKPLTAAAFYWTLTPLAPGLAWLLRTDLFVRPVSSKQVALGGGNLLAFAALYAICWIYGEGSFGSKQLIVGAVANAVALIGYGVGQLRGRLSTAVPVETVFYLPKTGDFQDNHLYAGLARYLQVASEYEPTGSSAAEALEVGVTVSTRETPGGSLGYGSLGDESDGRYALLQHVAGDDRCPCLAKSCSGGRFKWISTSAWGQLLYLNVVFVFTCFVMRFWSGLVTFAPQTWSTPWSATLGVASLAFSTFVATLNGLSNAAVFPNIPLLKLELGLHMRAVDMCLARLLSRMRIVAESSHPDFPLIPVDSEPHVVLHAALAASWRERFNVAVGARYLVIVGIFGEVASVCVMMIGAGCMNAGNLATLGVGLVYLAHDLLAISVVNMESTLAASAYISTAFELRTLAMPLVEGVSAHLRMHADLLERLAHGVDRFQSRFLGFPVTFAVCRAVALSTLTLGVAMYSVLRTAGIGVTLQSACPS